MTHISISVKEPFGIQWPKQYTIIDVSYNGSLDIKNLCLYNSLDIMTEADFISFKNNKLKIGFMLSLYPFETKKMYIADTPQDYKENKCISIKKTNGYKSISNSSLILHIPSSGTYYGNEIPAPVMLVSSKHISTHGIWKKEFDKAHIKVRIENKTLHARITIKYDFFEQGKYKAVIDMHKEMNEIVITETSDVGFSNSFIIKSSFIPKKTYARMHTPSKELGVPDQWKRITFNTSNQKNPIFLQPFYSWDKDTATLIQYYDDRLGICIVPINAGKWENAQAQNIKTYMDDSFIIEAPVNKGKRSWLLSLYSGLSYEKNNYINLRTDYQNWENMLDNPIERIYLSDRLCAVYGGINFSKTLEWLNIIQQNITYTPHVLADNKQIKATQERISNWPWMKNTIQQHKDDKAGFDPAGVYCALDDEKYALITKQKISIWLLSRIQLITTFGYSLHEIVCIRLSRPIRLIAIDFDLTCGSRHYSNYDKQFIYSAFVFIMRVIEAEDYWPDKKNGFRMGNRNFHSDRFSALGILACLLKDYPLSRQIIKYVQKQIEKELKFCIKDSGAWIEAPNYQAYSMNYLIILFTALKNNGHKNYFKNARFRKTLEFLSDIQTPYDIRYGAHMIPTLGDTAANYWSQSFSNIFAWAGKMTQGTSFSKKMIRAWKYAGSPVFSSGGELNSTFKMLLLTDNTLPYEKEKYKLLYEYEGFGAIARMNNSYLCLKSGDISMHYDHDESTIIWYENNTPLLIDIGSQYFPPCDASFMHNRISIDMKTDQARGSLICAKHDKDMFLFVTKTEISEIQEWPLWPITDPTWNFRYAQDPIKIDKHIWKRSIIYLMAHKALLIIDEVKGSLPFEQNFLLTTNSYEHQNNYYGFNGQTGMNMHIWTFNNINSEVMDWSYKGLDEPLFKKAFSMDWKDFTWMWDKPITNMEERVQILRNKFFPCSKAITFISAYSSDSEDKQNVEMFYNNNTLIWIKNGKKIEINLKSFNEKPFSHIVKEY